MKTSNSKKSLGLFEGYGIELEYMVVDKKGLDVNPIVDKVLFSVPSNTQQENEVRFEDISWSNELALHVIELKTSGPRSDLLGLHRDFQSHVTKVNEILSTMNSTLLPSSMHPWMDPHKQTKLWPHGNRKIYRTYDRLFNCSGHGWSNLQSMHINLPFQGDAEFFALHESIRSILPLLPSLVASSPFLEGKRGPCLDTRLWFYKDNQKRIPSIIGEIVPESVQNQRQYYTDILDRIENDIRPLDSEGVLEAEWLNSRGAITRFERMCIEIRVLDIQECPLSDLACAYFICEVLKKLSVVYLDWYRQGDFSRIHSSSAGLKNVFFHVIEAADEAVIEDKELLGLFSCWGIKCGTKPLPVKDLWWQFWNSISRSEANALYLDTVAFILNNGCLGRRMLKHVGDRGSLKETYEELAHCLDQGQLFVS